MKGPSTAGSEAVWDTEDLSRRLCHALDIAAKAIDRLALEGYTDPDEPANSLRPEKLISETAVLLVAAATADHHRGVGERVRWVAERLIPHARGERLLLGLCLEPALVLDFAQAHICLRRLGFEDRGFDALLRQSLRSQARGGRERVPHRMLELDWIRGIWKNTGPGAQGRCSPISRWTVLNRPMDLFGGSRDDIYAFTHALMYVRDFNIRPGRLPRPRSVILVEAEAALAGCLDAEDYDLGGEVLLAWPLTGKSWSAAAAFGFRVLARVEDKAGFLPAPATRLARLDRLQGDDRTDYLLATAYHTAFVMGLVCAAALQPGRTPPAGIPTGAAAAGCSKVLRFLDADAPEGTWRGEFDRLAGSERDALAGFVFNVALRRRMRERRFGAVAELLQAGLALGLADTPAASQAAEMLQRLGLFERIARERRSGNGPASRPPPGFSGGALDGKAPSGSASPGWPAIPPASSGPALRSRHPQASPRRPSAGQYPG